MRLAALSTRALVVAPIRLGLGLLGLVAARFAGAPAGVALVGFGVGTICLMFAALADPRQRFFALDDEPVPVPADARYDSPGELARAAIFPSTVGVSILVAISLTFRPPLAAILAGALAGMGLATLVYGIPLALWERRNGVRLYVEKGTKHVYERRG